MIGLCGAHRTGKTTLARLFAERRNIEFVETKGSAVFKELGYDPQVDYDFKTRLYIQRKILESAESLYRQQTGVFVTDRTPVDMLAYTVADVRRETVNGELADEFNRYLTDCYDVLNRNFNVLMLVQPGIPIVDDPTKGPANMAYIEHINDLMLGIMVSERVKCNHFYIPRHMTDLEDRLSSLERVVDKIEQNHDVLVATGEIVLH